MKIEKNIIVCTLLIIYALISPSTTVNSDTTVYSDKTVHFKGDYQILATVTFAELYSVTISENLNFNPMFQTMGDLNNDGINDIIISSSLHENEVAINEQCNVIFFLSSSGTLVKNTSLFNSIPKRVHAREGIVADFNGDGRNDFFDAATGVDGQMLGEQNILMLSTAQGKLAGVSFTHLPVQNDFSHGAGAGDIDGDGDLDIFVTNHKDDEQIKSSFLINDGTGNFGIDNSPSRISNSLIEIAGATSGINATYNTAKFFDMNGDNATDLLLATHGAEENYSNFTEFYYSRLVYNDGNGGFFAENTIEFPKGGYGITTLTTDIDPLDINGDGLIDLILAQTDGSSSNFWRGQYHQVLINDGNGGFVDETSSRIPHQDFSTVPRSLMAFPNQTFLEDIDLDGHLDIIVNSTEVLVAEPNITPTRIYMNDGSGRFLPLPNQTIYSGSDWVGRYLAPIDIDGDGDVDLVGVKNYIGSSTISGFELVLFENLKSTAKSAAGVKAFVTRFYQQCLGRSPELKGLTGWTNYLLKGEKTGADVAYGFAFSPEFLAMNTTDQEFLYVLYKAFFNRQPDTAGYNRWLNELSCNTPIVGQTEARNNVLNAFLGAPEFKTLCSNYGITQGSVTYVRPTCATTSSASSKRLIAKNSSSLLGSYTLTDFLIVFDDGTKVGSGDFAYWAGKTKINGLDIHQQITLNGTTGTVPSQSYSITLATGTYDGIIHTTTGTGVRCDIYYYTSGNQLVMVTDATKLGIIGTVYEYWEKTSDSFSTSPSEPFSSDDDELDHYNLGAIIGEIIK